MHASQTNNIQTCNFWIRLKNIVDIIIDEFSSLHYLKKDTTLGGFVGLEATTLG